MNSFRVVDTKFRILKGGKIGLSLSIALIGGILLCTTKANAQTFFTSAVTDGTIYTLGDISARAKSDDSISSDSNYTIVFPSEDIVFAPVRVSQSYIGVSNYEISGLSPNQSTVLPGTDGSVVGNYNSKSDGTFTYTDIYGDSYSATNYDRAYYENLNPDATFTVTLDSNTNANNISKSSSIYYYVDNTTGYTTRNDAYTANLIFTGSNEVSGNTNIDGGNIKLNGGVNFSGTVESGSIDVNTNETIIFNSAVNLSPGTTDIMKISTNGNIILNSNLIGNMTTTDNNQGIVTTTGSSQTITGNIGTSTSLDLSTLNIGSATDSTNYSSTTINGNVFASSTVLNNNGTTNSSSLILSNGSNVMSSITTADSNMGILTLLGSSTITGSVGTNTDKLSEVNSGATGSTSVITDNVYAVNVTNTGTGTTTFKNNVVVTNVNVYTGTTNIENNLTATNTNISTGTANLNTYLVIRAQI